LGFSSLGGEVGELGLKGADGIRSGISDLAAELKNPLRLTLEYGGQALRIWIKAHTQHTALGSPCGLELLGKGIWAGVHWD
jgi:hypothetical protein